jgi:hypothetical protein
MLARHRDVYELEMRKLSKRKAQLNERLDLNDAFVTDLLIDAALYHAKAELSWLSHVEETLKDRWPHTSEKRRRG